MTHPTQIFRGDPGFWIPRIDPAPLRRPFLVVLALMFASWAMVIGISGYFMRWW